MLRLCPKAVRRLCLATLVIAAAVTTHGVASQQKSRDPSPPPHLLPGPRSAIREVRGGRNVAAAAPRACLDGLREFLAYVSKDKPDIGEDAGAQRRWLSAEIRKRMAQYREAGRKYLEKNPNDRADLPDNQTFVGSWDQPSTYSVVGSRRYGRRAVIDVLYAWGAETNYPGDTRLTSYVFILEDGGWKLDDVYTFRGEFIHAHSLMDDLGRPPF